MGIIEQNNIFYDTHHRKILFFKNNLPNLFLDYKRDASKSKRQF